MYYVLHNSHYRPPQYVLLANDDKQYIYIYIHTYIHTHTHTRTQNASIMKGSNDDLLHTGFVYFCYFKHNTMFQLQLDPFPSYSEKNQDLPLPVALAAKDVAMSFHLRPETDPVSEILFVVTDNRQLTKPCTPTRSKMNIYHDKFRVLTVIYHRVVLKTLLTQVLGAYIFIHPFGDVLLATISKDTVLVKRE